VKEKNNVGFCICLQAKKELYKFRKIKTKRDKIWGREIKWCFVTAWRQKECVIDLERQRHKKIEW
jgi:hypothetical protein